MPRDPATHVGAVVKIDGVEIPCDPVSLDPGVLSGLKVTWGRADRLSRPGNSTCDFQLVDPDGGSSYADLIAYGSTVEVLGETPGGTRFRIFYGIVTDLSLKHEDGTDAVVSATAVDPTADMSAVMVGDTPWPMQTANARRTAILNAIGGSSVFYWQPFNSAIDGPAYYEMAAQDVDNQPAWQVITDFLWGIACIAWPIAYGSTGRAGIIVTGQGLSRERQLGINDTRAASTVPVANFLTKSIEGVQYEIPTVCLDACDIDLDSAEFTAHPDDTAMAVRLKYGNDDTEKVFVYAPELYDVNRTFEVDSGLEAMSPYGDTQPPIVADRWFDQMNQWQSSFDAPWRVSVIRIDPDTVTAIADFDLALRRLLDQTNRINHNLLLQHLPKWTPWRWPGASGSQSYSDVIGLLQGGVYTYDEGRWVIDLTVTVETQLNGELAPPLVVVVHPGDTVPYPHDDPNVTFQADPDTTWAPGQTAQFADGPYGWSGTAWIRGGVHPITVSPGERVDVAHDDPLVVPDPTTAWDEDEYARFSDGTYRWDGTAWAVYVAPVYVDPGDTSPLAHDDPAVRARPTTAWTAGQYATFSDGPYRWTGTAWQSVTLVAPGDTTTLAHTNLAAQPDPTTAWDDDEYAVFSDGTYRWTGTAWAAVATTTRINLCPDPRYLGPDAVQGGGASNWPTTDVTTSAPDGGGCSRVDAQADALGVVDLGKEADAKAAVAPGRTYTGSVYARTNHAGTPLQSFVPHIAWLDAAGATIGIQQGTPTYNITRDEWYRVYVTAVAPVGATQAWITLRVGYNPDDPTKNLKTGESVWFAQRMIEEGPDLLPYFDGDYPDTGTVDYSWTGAANASPSIQRALVVTVSPGTTVNTPHDSPGLVPDPDTAWDADDYATFSDGTYRWDGTAWVAYAGWITVATNYVTNPSFETGTTGWGRGTGATRSRDTTWAAQGNYSLKVTPPDGTTDAVFVYPSDAATEAGKTYTITATLHRDAPQAETGTYSGTIEAGGAMSEPAPNVAGDHVVSLTFTSTGGTIRLWTDGPVWWDLVTIVEGTQPLQFDGDTPDTDTVRHEWNGTPGNSTSTRQELSS